MKNGIKRLLSLFMALVMCMSFLPASALAEETAGEGAFTVLYADPSVKNHDFRADYEEMLQNRSGEASSSENGVANEIYYSIEDAGAELRSIMLTEDKGYLIGTIENGTMKTQEKNGAIEIKYHSDHLLSNDELNSVMYDIMDEAVEHDINRPNGGDYLYRGRMIALSAGANCSGSGKNYTTTFSYYPYMTTTVAQEAEADECYEEVLASLNMTSDLTDAQKIKTIYDWICNNIEYDYSAYNSVYYAVIHSAYSGIVDRSCVCQGYATVFYRLCLESGIDARSIGLESGHEWNIARVGDSYYFLDSTWDAGRTSKTYFLRGLEWWSVNHKASGIIFSPGRLPYTNTKNEVQCTEEYDVSDEDYTWPSGEQYVNVKFDYNGGAGTTAGKTLKYNEPYGELPVPDSRKGYDFSGWYTQKNEGSLVTSETVISTASDHTLYARWTAQNYTVMFDYCEGTGSTESKEVTYNSTYGELPSAEREGYTFSGWYTQADGGEEVTEDTTVSTAGNHTLYAQWSNNSATVTFNYCGGTGDTVSKEVAFGQEYGVLPSAEREGYTFNGWYTSKTEGDKVTSETIVSTAGDHTLYAQWSNNSATVTFDYCGGTGDTVSSEVTYGLKYGDLPEGERTGYILGGWYTQESGGSKVTSNTTVSTAGDHTLYARWVENTYTVVFKPNKGDGTMDAIKVKYTETAELDANQFTREGYNFWGWSTDSKSTERLFEDGAVVSGTELDELANENSRVILYAIWQPYADGLAIENDDGEDVTSQTLQAAVYGPEVQLRAKATSENSPPEPEQIFSWSSDKTSIATVSEDGLVTFIAPGSVKITATALDGSELSSSVNFKVSYLCAGEELVVRATDTTGIEEKFIDGSGDISETDTGSYALYIDAGKQQSTFTIGAYAKSAAGEYIPIDDSKAVKYTSSSSSVASVKINKDGTATVTVKGGASGACTISAVTNDDNKLTGSIAVYVRDYKPRTDTSTLTLDTQKINEAALYLVPSYGNEIIAESLSVLEYNSKTKSYEQSDRLRVDSYDQQSGRLVISANGLIKNGTVKAQLQAGCSITGIEKLDLTIKVKNTTPSVTIKQTKFNTFCSDSESSLTVSVKNETIESVELKSDCFDGLDNGEGTVTVRFRDGMETVNPAKAATLSIKLAGYAYPVEKSFTVSTVKTKPSLAIEPSAIIVNTELSDSSPELAIYDKTNGIYIAAGDITSKPDWIESLDDGDNGEILFTLSPSAGKSGKAVFEIKRDSWLEPVKVSCTISKKAGIPAAKLGTGTLTLNRFMTGKKAETTLTTGQSNVKCSGIAYELSSAPKGVDIETADAWFNLNIEDEKLDVSLAAAGRSSAAAGKYIFTVTPSSGDTELAPVKLTVAVLAKAPQCSAAAITLNKRLNESGKLTAGIDSEYCINGYDEIEEGEVYVTQDGNLRISYDSDSPGKLSVELTDTARKLNAQTFTVTLHPEAYSLYDAEKTDRVPCGAVTLKVKMIDSAVSAAISSSGKIDTVSRTSGIAYTVTKLSNTVASISDCTLTGDDAELFEELEDTGLDAKGRQTYLLKLKDDVEVSKNKTCNVQLHFTLDTGDEFDSKVLSVKPTQSTVRFTAANASQTVYQSQSRYRWVTYTVSAASPSGAEIDEISVGDVSLFQKALVNAADNIVISKAEDGKSATVSVLLKDTSKLTAGKTYTLPLEITAKGAMANTKPTKLNLTLKVQK